MPVDWIARMADSRPAPGPRTTTSTVRTPASRATPAQFCAATWAAKGVPLREPLKPIRPAEDQAIELPSGSQLEMIVLLKVACTCGTPWGTTLRSFLATFSFFAVGVAAAAGLAMFYLPLLLRQLLLGR